MSDNSLIRASYQAGHQYQSPFDVIKHYSPDGSEFWHARELMKIMGYTRWERFIKPIENAIENIELNGDQVSQHISLYTGSSVTKDGAVDYKLSRYGCYMVALCCDGRKPEVAQSKKYFATKTREAEVIVPAQNDRIRELELQIQLVSAEKEKAIAEQKLIDTRHLVVSTCPEPVQQKILGFQIVEKIEYRDRIIHESQVLRDGSTVNKTELCRRYGLVTKSGNPDYKRLNSVLSKMPDRAFQTTSIVMDNKELRREFLVDLDEVFFDQRDRQLYLAE
jgi:hypothetical protein